MEGRVINMLKHITADEFNEEVLNYNGKVLVDFFATWCGPCQMLTPVLEKFDEEENEIKIVKVNIDEETKLAIENGVQVVPTLILYDNGKLVKRLEGYRDKEELREEIL